MLLKVIKQCVVNNVPENENSNFVKVYIPPARLQQSENAVKSHLKKHIESYLDCQIWLHWQQNPDPIPVHLVIIPER